MAFTPVLLSGSANGKPIQISSTTSGAANTIHQAGSGTTNHDRVFLEVINVHDANVKLYIGHGGVTAAETLGPIVIEPNTGLQRVAENLCLDNSLYIKAWSDNANKLLVTGHVVRYTA